MGNGSALESALKRDRLLVMIALAVIVVVAAGYTLASVGMNMSAVTMTKMAIEMPAMVMKPVDWSISYALMIFLMWCLMMIAMMVPSAAPMVLVHAAIGRKQEARPLTTTALFVLGYVAVWVAFSLIATVSQWALESLGVVTGMMDIASPAIAGLVLISAGLYQLTSLKEACLKHCQNPLSFIIHHWRPGKTGAFRMGLEHGSYCLGCCLFLMALLFVGGIMNLIWIAGIAVYVGIEKFSVGHRITVATGMILIVAGVFMLARPLLAA